MERLSGVWASTEQRPGRLFAGSGKLRSKAGIHLPLRIPVPTTAGRRAPIDLNGVRVRQISMNLRHAQ